MQKVENLFFDHSVDLAISAGMWISNINFLGRLKRKKNASISDRIMYDRHGLSSGKLDKKITEYPAINRRCTRYELRAHKIVF